MSALSWILLDLSFDFVVLLFVIAICTLVLVGEIKRLAAALAVEGKSE